MGFLHHLGQRGHGADLDAAIRVVANSLELLDTAQVDHHLRFLDAVLEPVEAIEPSGQHPGIPSMLCEQLLRVRRWSSAEAGQKRALHLELQPWLFSFSLSI